MTLIICVILSKVQHKTSKFHQRDRFITIALNAFEIRICNEFRCPLLINIID